MGLKMIMILDDNFPFDELDKINSNLAVLGWKCTIKRYDKFIFEKANKIKKNIEAI